MACNCSSHSNLSESLSGELGFWPFDWLEEKATEFCMNKAFEQLTPVVLLMISILLILILGGRLKWA
ncbi:hypothetical protein DLM76_17260 [Leptospira yasudae]|uniref:hypothetical protein n=1 Tax=Leptospira yasudae TaxID=2202201 RepID=UPI000E59B34F|nr:hypothetical protein [Leptospira yasudae]RHX91663.1 hypothetical protein DLM76_17260 [Leptospira yasudae]